MSGKIDLAELTDLCELTTRPAVTPEELLALVAGVRSALALVADLRRVGPESWAMFYVEKHAAALAPFTDSGSAEGE